MIGCPALTANDAERKALLKAAGAERRGGCKATIGAPEIGPQQPLMNAVAWPFPRIVGRDGLPVSPIWRASRLGIG